MEQHFRFLDLPTPVRDRTYDFLTFDREDRMKNKNVEWQFRPEITLRNFPLTNVLCSCRQISDEYRKRTAELSTLVFVERESFWRFQTERGKTFKGLRVAKKFIGVKHLEYHGYMRGFWRIPPGPGEPAYDTTWIASQAWKRMDRVKQLAASLTQLETITFSMSIRPLESWHEGWSDYCDPAWPDLFYTGLRKLVQMPQLVSATIYKLHSYRMTMPKDEHAYLTWSRESGWRNLELERRSAVGIPRKPFRLLDLPAELRDKIYDITLLDAKTLHFRHEIDQDCLSSATLRRYKYTPLLLVSHQILDEYERRAKLFPSILSGSSENCAHLPSIPRTSQVDQVELHIQMTCKNAMCLHVDRCSTCLVGFNSFVENCVFQNQAVLLGPIKLSYRIPHGTSLGAGLVTWGLDKWVRSDVVLNVFVGFGLWEQIVDDFSTGRQRWKTEEGERYMGTWERERGWHMVKELEEEAPATSDSS